jgi:hypothetical protein
MILHQLISWLFSFLDSRPSNSILARPPNWKSIATSAFPKLHSEFLHCCIELPPVSFYSWGIFNLNKGFVPQWFCDHIFNALYEMYFSLDIFPPLLQNIPLLRSIMVAKHLPSNHLHTLLQSISINSLHFLNLSSLLIQLLWCIVIVVRLLF